MKDFGEEYFNGDFEHIHPEPIGGSEVYATFNRKGDVVKISYFQDAARTILLDEIKFKESDIGKP